MKAIQKMNAAFRRNAGAAIASIRTGGTKVAAGVTAMVAAGSASAQDGLGDAALTAITGLETDVQAILLVLVGVAFLFVLYSWIKRAR